jgi:hypothetical protein
LKTGFVKSPVLRYTVGTLMVHLLVRDGEESLLEDGYHYPSPK